MLISTGTSLRTLDTFDLFDATYALMTRTATMTEDEHKAIDSLDSKISNSVYEAETGMPSVTQWMMPANQADLPEDLRISPFEES